MPPEFSFYFSALSGGRATRHKIVSNNDANSALRDVRQFFARILLPFAHIVNRYAR
jgi:hypothetical protein